MEMLHPLVAKGPPPSPPWRGSSALPDIKREEGVS